MLRYEKVNSVSTLMVSVSTLMVSVSTLVVSLVLEPSKQLLIRCGQCALVIATRQRLT